MNDHAELTSGALERIEPETADEPTSYGARLAWHRERVGFSVAEVASRLRLSANHIRAIEAENLDALPVLAYVRGFIRSYARVVGVDAAPLLEDLSTRLSATESASARVGDRATLPRMGDGRTSRRVVVAAAVAVLVALGAIGWNTTSRLPVRSAVVEPSSVVAPSPAASVDRPAPVAVVDNVAENPPAEVAAASITAAPAVSPPGPSATESVMSSVIPAAAAAEPASSATLSIAFDGPCWVEVMAANGRVVHSQLHNAGSQAEINAPVPLSIVLGDGGNARVTVRGKPFDIAPFMRQNVARFTLDR